MKATNTQLSFCGHVLNLQINPEKWVAKKADFVLDVLSKASNFEGRPASNISEWLNGDKVRKRERYNEFHCE
jgi:hypothetical protein